MSTSGVTPTINSERYQRALARVEQMGYVVLGLSVLVLILLFA